MKKCCNKQGKFEIVYDCGIGIQELVICEHHYNLDPVFQRNIKSIKEIKN